jgi:hypothetical protein
MLDDDANKEVFGSLDENGHGFMAGRTRLSVVTDVGNRVSSRLCMCACESSSGR